MVIKKSLIGAFGIMTLLALGSLVPTKVSAQADFVIEQEAGKQTLVEYTGNEKNVVIPEGVEVVCYDSFSDNKVVESIELPDSVTQIGSHAFSGCTNLKSIKLSENLETIDGCAFLNCENLENIILGKNVNYIGEFAFGGCTSLEKVTVTKGNKAFVIKKGALYSKNMKNLYLYPAARNKATLFIVPKSVTYINDYAFFGNKYLKSIVIKGSVEAGGECVFSNCKSLTKLEFKKPYKGGFMADNCKKLKTVILAEGTTRIMANQFEGCTSLKKINFPSGLKQIGAYAFYDCKNLKNIKFPDGMKKIGKKAFKGCEKLKNVSVPPTVKVAENAFN